MIDFGEDYEDFDSTNNAPTANDDGLWVNKYRPRTLERFCLEGKLKTVFQRQIDENDVQNLCLIGGPGIGKTTLALILANSIKDSNVMFVSCAAGQGKVEFIQSNIIPFCQAASRGRKFVILDELDSASSTQANSFQKALRNVIEAYPDVRFIATANYQHNIIPAICPSRMSPKKLSFSVSDMISNLLYILGEENVEIASEPAKTKQFLGNLIKSYYPDMRAVIGLLQSACVGKKLDVDEIVLDNKTITKTTLSQFLEMVSKSDTPLNLRKAYNNEILALGNNGALANLCSPYGFAKGLFDYIVENCNASVEDLMSLADYLYRIENSVDAESQLFGFLLKVKTLDLKNHV